MFVSKKKYPMNSKWNEIECSIFSFGVVAVVVVVHTVAFPLDSMGL